MKLQKCSLSLERMLGFIMELNGITMLQFVIYAQREKVRPLHVNERFIFAYGENELRKFFQLLAGQAVHLSAGYYEKKPEENLGLTSIVKIRGGERHIPMIDFGCSCSESNLLEVEKTLLNLGQKQGFVLESGGSYHFYGMDMLTETEWREFMEKCKKQPAVDKDWPRYQLADKFSALRVSTSTSKPILPKVIAQIGNFIV